MKKKRGHEREHEKGKSIRHIIFGAEDGLISTLGFLSGVTGAHLSTLTIAIVGIAEIFAAALSMGIGTYLSSKSQTEVLQRNIDVEKSHLERSPVRERKELEEMYKKKGFKGKELEKIVNKLMSNKKIALNEMMTSELGIIPGKGENPIRSAFVMFGTFMILAMIPFTPYLLFSREKAIAISVIATVSALFCVGALKTRLTRKNWFTSGLEMLIFGVCAAFVTYYIGQFISSLY